MKIQANKMLLTLLMEFWDLSKVTFKFLDFKITPTLEEFSKFT